MTSRAGPPLPESAKHGPKWTRELAEFIREQYLTHRKSAGEIALMLGPAFTRNAVTGKLYRMGALQARSGIALGKTHGLPKVNHFCPGRKAKAVPEENEPVSEPDPKDLPANPAAAVREEEHLEGSAFVQTTEKLHEATGSPILTAAVSGKPAFEGYISV